MARLGESVIAWVGSVTIMGAIVASAWWLAKLDDRIERMEAQLQAIATSPQARSPAEPGTSAAASFEQTCANLAEREAGAIDKKDLDAQSALDALIDRLGCSHKTGEDARAENAGR
jgi:hypothetical protein